MATTDTRYPIGPVTNPMKNQRVTSLPLVSTSEDVATPIKTKSSSIAITQQRYKAEHSDLRTLLPPALGLRLPWSRAWPTSRRMFGEFLSIRQRSGELPCFPYLTLVFNKRPDTRVPADVDAIGLSQFKPLVN